MFKHTHQRRDILKRGIYIISRRASRGISKPYETRLSRIRTANISQSKKKRGHFGFPICSLFLSLYGFGFYPLLFLFIQKHATQGSISPQILRALAHSFKNGKTVQAASSSRSRSTVVGSVLGVRDQDGADCDDEMRSRFSVLHSF